MWARRGSGADEGRLVRVDRAGNAHLTGETSSDEQSFPVKAGPDLAASGSQDAYIAKIAHTLLEASGAPRPGGTVNLTLTATDDAWLPYVLGSSLAPARSRSGTDGSTSLPTIYWS